jgi:hypothetical protein
MVPRAAAAGVRARAFGRARSDLDQYSFHPLATVFGYTSSPAVGEELAGIVAADDPDLVVVDAMFAAALAVAPRFGRPTAVMLHTFCYRLIDMWRANFAMQSQSRQRAGFDALPTLDELWGERDLLHVAVAGLRRPRRSRARRRRHRSAALQQDQRVRHGAGALTRPGQPVPQHQTRARCENSTPIGTFG